MVTEDETALIGLSDWKLTFATASPSHSDILASLTRKVQDLLEHDRRFLFQAFYRLDIDEEKVNWVMQKEAKVTQAERIAELIIQRELQKAKSRL